MGAVTRDEQRRAEIAEMFSGLSIFDRGVSFDRRTGSRKGSTIGYRKAGSWLAPKPRERKEKPPKPTREPRQAMPRKERLRRKAMRENGKYHALGADRKRARGQGAWKRTKADPAKLDRHRARGRKASRTYDDKRRAKAGLPPPRKRGPTWTPEQRRQYQSAWMRAYRAAQRKAA